MKLIKRGLVFALVMSLLLPAQPVAASNTLLQSNVEGEQKVTDTERQEQDEEDTENSETKETETETEQEEEEETEESLEEEKTEAAKPEEKTEEETEQETDEKADETLELETSEIAEETEEENTEQETTMEETVKQIVSEIKDFLQKEIEVINKEVMENIPIATPGNAKKSLGEEVKFNTGSHVWTVVDQEDFFDNEMGDAYFDEDGSYTINIPEENPFFPYEVQFTYKNKTVNKWFMTPDDSVEMGGHTFYVSAYFDGTVVTQMSLEVAGDTVVVYPEKKKFTNGDGISVMSLLPLKEKRLNIDLSSYTPVDLTMVKFDTIFTGADQLKDTDKVMWAYGWEDSYKIIQSGDTIDLSYHTAWNTSTNWQMIVGEDNQLAKDNTRYLVTINVTKSNDWLTTTLYMQDSQGKRTKVETVKIEGEGYSDNRGRYRGARMLRIYRTHKTKIDREATLCVGLNINPDVFPGVSRERFKVYVIKSNYSNPEEAIAKGEDITQNIFSDDMTQMDAGIKGDSELFSALGQFRSEEIFALVTYDSTGKQITGFLPMNIYIVRLSNYVETDGLYAEPGAQKQVSYDWDYDMPDAENEWDANKETYIINFPYSANSIYYHIGRYMRDGVESSSSVTAAYAGRYSSIKEAKAANAEDIKDSLFNPQKGYGADYSKGVDFTVFIGDDGSVDQEIHCYGIKTRDGGMGLSGSTVLEFTGLNDSSQTPVGNCYSISGEEDSYSDNSYLTILVDKNVDLTNLAPIFRTGNGIKLYAEGSSSPEISGQSTHDFSKGPVHYTVSAENEKDQKNYWLQVVRAENGAGKLYINSLAGEESETKTGASGEITSTREMFLNARQDYAHNILVANMGTEDIPDLAVKLVSDEVILDNYWTLKGSKSLPGFSTANGADYEKLPNLAKIRLLPKSGVDDGRDISGTLTISSGSKVLMVLNLTGAVGDPDITTTEIPNAVKYVPYGTMIQNNNRYDWNQVSYALIGGELPDGMVIKPNGELYGVPVEDGTFEFTVRMKNSYYEFQEREKTFTLTVAPNTDANVDAATDPGYELSQRVQNFSLSSSGDQTLVSQGVYEEFVDVFLDGVKLKEGQDYTSESGSTRITIRSQTLKASNKPGTHTLGIEFRKKDNTLKRAAQNYEITASGSSSNGNTGGSSSGGRSGSRSTRSGGATVIRDPKKGYVHSELGIVTMEKAGYSHWQQDEKGWKLVYADGTIAGGYMTILEDGREVEQVVWEKINGSWYAFGVDGYIKSGWVYDYRLGSWYNQSIDTGMRTGWYTDTEDTHTYYLNPEEGGMAAGWWRIDRKWYYFNTIVTEASWEFNRETGNWQYNTKSKSKPFGSMYRAENTPDGYYVGADGVWDGKEK